MDGRGEEKPNIIFLDIDGVLNNYNTEARCQGFVGVSGRLVKILKKIAEQTNAKIVLSSSWKSEWTNDPYLDDDPYYYAGRYLNAKLSKCRLRIMDRTKDDGINRGYGIRRWLDTHPHGNWIVLDDEVFPDFELCGIMPQLVFTKGVDMDGLKEEHIEEAVQKMQQEIAYPEYYDIREKKDTDVDGFCHSGKGL